MIKKGVKNIDKNVTTKKKGSKGKDKSIKKIDKKVTKGWTKKREKGQQYTQEKE